MIMTSKMMAKIMVIFTPDFQLPVKRMIVMMIALIFLMINDDDHDVSAASEVDEPREPLPADSQLNVRSEITIRGKVV